MMLKNWSGKVVINEIEVNVNAKITSNEWHGNGSFNLKDYPKLYETLIKRESCQTMIGTLYLTELNTNGTCSFRGTGAPLFSKEVSDETRI